MPLERYQLNLPAGHPYFNGGVYEQRVAFNLDATHCVSGRPGTEFTVTQDDIVSTTDELAQCALESATDDAGNLIWQRVGSGTVDVDLDALFAAARAVPSAQHERPNATFAATVVRWRRRRQPSQNPRARGGPP